VKLAISLILLVGLLGQKFDSEYTRPECVGSLVKGNVRYFVKGQSARPQWVTTKWDPKADKPFESILVEIRPFREFKGPDLSGTWPKKARSAYAAWKKDWNDPVKWQVSCRPRHMIGATVQELLGPSGYITRTLEITQVAENKHFAPRLYTFVKFTGGGGGIQPGGGS
jgi:hypothetical protein